MTHVLDPFRFVLIAFAGWMNGRQSLIIDFLREENRVLGEQLGGKRLRFTDDQRRRLAARAKGLGRNAVADLSTIVTPETPPAWHRGLIAQKYDGSEKRAAGRPRNPEDIEKLGRAHGEREPHSEPSANPGPACQSGARHWSQHDGRDLGAERN